jgi:hypothetical protein
MISIASFNLGITVEK